jgi:signal peptidase II
MKRTLAMLGLVSGCVGCDQGTKHLAEQALRSHGQSYLGGAVQLFYAENTGAFGSLGSAWPASLKLVAFILLPIAVLIGIGVQAVRTRTNEWLPVVAGAFIVGGGLGNIWDRVVSGHVVDFVYLHVGSLGTNVFNVADVAVMAGVVLLVLDRPRRPAPSSSL